MKRQIFSLLLLGILAYGFIVLSARAGSSVSQPPISLGCDISMREKKQSLDTRCSYFPDLVIRPKLSLDVLPRFNTYWTRQLICQSNKSPQDALRDLRVGVFLMHYDWPTSVPYSQEQAALKKDVLKQLQAIESKNGEAPETHLKMAQDLETQHPVEALVEYGEVLRSQPQNEEAQKKVQVLQVLLYQHPGLVTVSLPLNGKADLSQTQKEQQDIAQYINRVNKRIRAKWKAPPAESVSMGLNRVVALLGVQQDGTIVNPSIVCPSGIAALDATAMSALSKVTLKPLPQALALHAPIWIQFSFDVDRNH